MKQWLEKYRSWIVDSYPITKERLGIYRLFYSLFLLIIVGLPKFHHKIAAFPDGFFNPPPFFSLFFNGLPPLLYFQITDYLIVIGLFMVAIGLFTRTAGIITSLILVINHGFLFSTGKIDHNFMAWFTLFVMSFSGWGLTFSMDQWLNPKRKADTKNWTISLLSMALGFGFFTAGLIKLVSGWLSLKDSMLQAFFMRNYYVQQKQDYLASMFEHLDFRFFWESGDWFTILFEIGFLVAIITPKTFRFFTLLALFFHGAVLLMMNISFDTYIPIYLLFWVPLLPQSFIDKVLFRWQSFVSKKVLVLGCLLVLLAIVATRNFALYGQLAYVSHVMIFSTFIIALFMLLFKPRWVFADATDQQKSGIIRFDGVCNLCNTFVQFVIKRDKKNHFKFATLQNSTFDKGDKMDTIYLEEKGKLEDRSTAFLEITRRLNAYWPYLYLFVFVPKPIRDMVYKIVSKYRYQWFGKKDQCMIPTPALKDKFL